MKKISKIYNKNNIVNDDDGNDKHVYYYIINHIYKPISTLIVFIFVNKLIQEKYATLT